MDGPSIIKEHAKAIVEAIRRTAQNDWKVLVIDETTKKIIDSSVNEDDILNYNVANVERIEERRQMNPDMDAIYILSPQPHIVECLVADLERRRYRRGFIIWAGVVPDALQRRLDVVQRQMAGPPDRLLVDFYPRESHLVTFADPSSFLMLYNPSCNDLVARHLQTLASKIVSVCITLQEVPKIRYYQPPDHARHEARVLCMHLARFVQQGLDAYQQWNRHFPPPSQRPQSVLLVADRSMDPLAPLLHEFTYQAMAHDLLPIRERDDGKPTYRVTINEGTSTAEEKDMELVEKDSVWVDNRHRHMKDTIDKLMEDFQKFLEQNPDLSARDASKVSLNDIKNVLANLPQFQEAKQAYSLHLSMAQEAMGIFQKYKLSDIASVEQTLATGLDEDYKKPKNILDQLVRLLDDPGVAPADRLRLIAIYALYRDGMIEKDLTRLLWHASLQKSRDSLDQAVIENLDALGARPLKDLKEPRQPLPPLFPPKTKNAMPDEEYALSRYEPAVKQMLEHLCAGDLDTDLFPYTVPPADGGAEPLAAQGSLRSAAPRWASANRRQAENRQRIIVFVAGGATYSEARVCYEVSEKHNRDVFLTTSHMVTPAKFLADLRVLKADRRRLDLPMDRPPPKPPAHLFERPGPTPPPPQQQQQQAGMGAGRQMPPGAPRPPTKALAGMALSSGSGPSLGAAGGGGVRPDTSGSDSGKKKEKKKRNIFGIKK